MSDTPELLMCPFCGGSAELWRAHVEPKRAAWVACTGRCAVVVSKEYETDAEAIAAWNSRSPSAAYAAGAAEMRGRAAVHAKAMAADAIAGAVACHGEMSDYEMQAAADDIAAEVAALPLPPFDREAAEEKMARAIARGRWPCSVAPGKSCGGSLLCTCEQAARAALSALMGER